VKLCKDAKMEFVVLFVKLGEDGFFAQKQKSLPKTFWGSIIPLTNLNHHNMVIYAHHQFAIFWFVTLQIWQHNCFV
jgi:hypothetical protein